MTDQFVLGLGLTYNSTKEEVPDYSETTTSDMVISPWMRIYMNEMFFIHAGVDIGSGSTKKDYDSATGLDDTTDKRGSFGLMAGPGLSLMWGDYIAVEPAMLIQMGSGWSKPDGGDKANLPSTFNVGFQIGVAIMLGNQ